MDNSRNSVLILALGNDVMGKAGIGLAAARQLKEELEDSIDLVESREPGPALLDIMENYDKVLILDVMTTGAHPPGTILELSPKEFHRLTAASVHYAGFPEVVELAEQLSVWFPAEVRILAMEVEDPFEAGEKLNEVLQEEFPRFVAKAQMTLTRWLEDRS